MSRFEVFMDTQGEWRYRLRGGNGELMCQSESYRSKRDALRGVRQARLASLTARVVDGDGG